MVNLKEYTLKSGGGERLLFLSPVNLQSPEMPMLSLFKVYVYEDLIKEDMWGHLRDEDKQNLDGLIKPKLVIKHDQNFEKAYIGNLTINLDKKEESEWEGDSSRLTKREIEELVIFLTTDEGNKE